MTNQPSFNNHSKASIIRKIIHSMPAGRVVSVSELTEVVRSAGVIAYDSQVDSIFREACRDGILIINKDILGKGLKKKRSAVRADDNAKKKRIVNTKADPAQEPSDIDRKLDAIRLQLKSQDYAIANLIMLITKMESALKGMK